MMNTPLKTRLKANGHITLPAQIRELLNVHEGDDLFFSLNREGQIVISHVQPTPAEQAWFWSKDWQTMEHAAQQDVTQGKVYHYANIESAIADLEKLSNARD